MAKRKKKKEKSPLWWGGGGKGYFLKSRFVKKEGKDAREKKSQLCISSWEDVFQLDCLYKQQFHCNVLINKWKPRKNIHTYTERQREKQHPSQGWRRPCAVKEDMKCVSIYNPMHLLSMQQLNYCILWVLWPLKDVLTLGMAPDFQRLRVLH